MSIAEKYLREQLSSEEFRRSYLEEKMKLDIEYRLGALKKDIQEHKSADELIKKATGQNDESRLTAVVMRFFVATPECGKSQAAHL